MWRRVGWCIGPESFPYLIPSYTIQVLLWVISVWRQKNGKDFMNSRAGLHIPCIIMCALIFIECLLNSIKCSALGIHLWIDVPHLWRNKIKWMDHTVWLQSIHSFLLRTHTKIVKFLSLIKNVWFLVEQILKRLKIKWVGNNPSNL